MPPRFTPSRSASILNTTTNALTLSIACLTFLYHYIMPRSPCAKNWVFTWNNYPDNYKEVIQEALDDLEDAICLYHAIGEETGESGTPHLQGFLSFSQRFSHPAQKLWQAHWEVCKRPHQSILYCKKGEQSKEEWNQFKDKGENYGRNAVVWENGSMPQKRGAQGKRTDLHELRDTVRDTFASGETFTMRDARDLFPDTYARYPNFVLDTIKDFKPKREVPTHELRPWQIDLNEYLNRPPSDREVVFVVDHVGNAGKSWFARHYRSLHENVQIIRPGPTNAMLMLMNEDTRVFFFDCPRSKMEHLQYGIFELLKDGDVTSTKYWPIEKEWLHDVHVVVLMNQMPDMEALSADRYKIIQIS